MFAAVSQKNLKIYSEFVGEIEKKVLVILLFSTFADSFRNFSEALIKVSNFLIF